MSILTDLRAVPGYEKATVHQAIKAAAIQMLANCKPDSKPRAIAALASFVIEAYADAYVVHLLERGRPDMNSLREKAAKSLRDLETIKSELENQPEG